MFSVIKSSWKIFFRNADYVETIFGPLLMLLIFSFILAFNSEKVIGIAESEKYSDTVQSLHSVLDEADGIRVVKITDGEETMNVAVGNADAVISIDEISGKPVIITSENNKDFADFLRSVVNASVNNDTEAVNAVITNASNRGRVSIANSLGVVIFKVITGAALLGGTLIYERNRGIKQRIIITGIKYSSYILGKCFVYFVNSVIALVLYYLLALIMHFDFGMKHSILFFLIMLFIDIYAISLYCLLSVFCNNRSNLWSVAVCIVLPMSLLSGTFVQFDKMPVVLQNIGNLFPQRWVCIAIEKVQQGQGFKGAFPACAGLLVISALFFAITFIRGKNIPMASGNSVDT